MLQLRLEDAIIYAEDESTHIDAIIKKYAWYDQKQKTFEIKARISEHTLLTQKIRCVYCERILIKLNPQIEHIADKATYTSFSFEPLNLATACGDCNGSRNKHDENVVKAENEVYAECEFKMVHPYLNVVAEHFVYSLDGDVVYDYDSCSEQAQFTIDMLNMNTYEWYLMYSQIQEEKAKPIDINMERLIYEISSYKRR